MTASPTESIDLATDQSANLAANLATNLAGTLALAADAMFVIALLAAGRVLPGRSPPHATDSDAAVIVSLAFIGTMFQLLPRTGVRVVFMLASILAAVAAALPAILDPAHDIGWVVRIVLAAHLALLAALPSRPLWKFVLVFSCLIWFVSY